MNYLAHLFLSGSNNDILIGNFIGDAVKGNAYLKYPEPISFGVKMHRAIDSYTDQHEIVLEGKKRLYSNHHKYSGIIVDLFYDYFLCKNWSTYSNQSLKKFISSKYDVLNRNYGLMPHLSQLIFRKMVDDDWLNSYQSVTGISKALNGLSHRTKFKNNMQNAGSDLLQYEELFEKEFNRFFPKLIDFCDSYKKRYGQA